MYFLYLGLIVLRQGISRNLAYNTKIDDMRGFIKNDPEQQV